MISVEEALEVVESNRFIKKIRLEKALGLILAQDAESKTDSPPFSNSAMDGYAVYFQDKSDLREFEILGNIYAEESNLCLSDIEPNQAYKIMTGAPVPKGFSCVIPKEYVENYRQNNKDFIRIKPDYKLGKFKNIRHRGEEIKLGEIALKKNHKITPASIGYLRGLGVFEVEVFDSNLEISIIPTGSELVRENRELKHGEIYETNALMLKVACEELGVKAKICETVPDDLIVTRKILKQELESLDSNKKNKIILISGGVSVGDKDLVKNVLAELGVEKLFWRVNQKPGKPLFFGKKESEDEASKVLVFGLPGNPAASLTCFYVYVRELLSSQPASSAAHSDVQLGEQGSIMDRIPRAQFLKANYDENKLKILENQGSHMLSSFSEANCLVYVPALDSKNDIGLIEL